MIDARTEQRDAFTQQKDLDDKLLQYLTAKEVIGQGDEDTEQDKKI